MTKTTTVNAIPYPEDADPPNGPAQIKALADLLDTLKWPARNLKPGAKVDIGGADMALTTEYQDVTGSETSLTLAVESQVLILATFYFTEIKEGSGAGLVRVGAEDRGENTCLFNVPGTALADGTVPFIDLVTLAAGTHTFKLRARKFSATAAAKVKSGVSKLIVIPFAA